MCVCVTAVHTHTKSIPDSVSFLGINRSTCFTSNVNKKEGQGFGRSRKSVLVVRLFWDLNPQASCQIVWVLSSCDEAVMVLLKHGLASRDI